MNGKVARHFIYLFLLISVIATGCARAPLPSVSVPPTAYKSKDYIIYRMEWGDTPQSLARRFLGDAGKDWQIEEANDRQMLKPDNYIVIPLKIKNKGGVSSDGVQTVPILCYHRFGNHCESPLCVPEKTFERQMKYLKDNGYRVITPETMLAFLEYRQPLPRKSVMITVDDGYRSFYNIAYPILKRYGFPATMFVYTDYVGVSSKAITWDQLRELKANGFTIGSHTRSHSDLTKKDRKETDEAYLKRLRHEIIDSKKIIDRELNQDTFFFSYPFGRANHQAMLMAHQAGYKLAATVHRGGNAFFSNRYLLKRDQVLKRDMQTFKSRLKTFYPLSLR